MLHPITTQQSWYFHTPANGDLCDRPVNGNGMGSAHDAKRSRSLLMFRSIKHTGGSRFCVCSDETVPVKSLEEVCQNLSGTVYSFIHLCFTTDIHTLDYTSCQYEAQNPLFRRLEETREPGRNPHSLWEMIQTVT